MNIEKMICKSAEAALTEWHKGQWNRQVASLDDLTHDLWVWYLERPSVRKKLVESDEYLSRRLIYKAAMQILAEGALSADVFDGRVLFSSDAVKDALRGNSDNTYLLEILPFALRNLENRPKYGPVYAEAIRSRYTDGVVPQQGSAHVRLVRALKALTEEANVIYLTTEHDSIGSKGSVFPDTRKRKGEHSDPTGNIAMLLMDNPEMRESFYEETPLHQFLGGRGASREHVLGFDSKQRPIKFRSGR